MVETDAPAAFATSRIVTWPLIPFRFDLKFSSFLAHYVGYAAKAYSDFRNLALAVLIIPGDLEFVPIE
jgi:hypothetical protein